VKREFNHPKIKLNIKDGSVVLGVVKATKREKKMLKTYVAHVGNLFKGVVNAFHYRLKICSSHFPMNVSVNNNKLTIKNFLGEKSPRVLDIKAGVDVKVNGDVIDVSSCDKELAGNVASDIELLTKKTGKDVRIFQDGIYIIDKGGKLV
ncbi:50S ribosomal protein L6, partial [Candidatus Woesearchaeota archaeon]